MTYHLRLKNAMSYTGVVNATREEPDVFTADEAIKAAALRSGYFDLVDVLAEPDIGSGGDTLNTYALDFSLFVKFFHRTKEDAYELGYTALNALLERRNRIPLIDESGKPTGKYIRIRDPTLRAVDESAVQLQIDWTARKPFADAPETMMQTYEIETQIKRSYDAAKAEQEVLYGIQSNH